MDLLLTLERRRAILNGYHFVYASGLHGSLYVSLRGLHTDEPFMLALGRQLTQPFRQREWEPPDTVTGPAIGGNELSRVAAKALEHARVRRALTTRIGDEYTYMPDVVHDIKDKRVWVLEDTVTTGSSLGKVCRLVESFGGTVTGASVVCNRGGITAETMGIPWLESLLEVRSPAYREADCPLCARQVPIIDNHARGAKFKAAHPYYPGGYRSL